MTLLAILSISLVLFSFSIKTTTLAQAHCLPDQRDALIQLKQGFNTTQLHSWNASTDCCKWDGITCDKQTGMVTTVDLYDRSISGEINPALFNLTSLQKLDLSGNYFYNITLPQIGFERLGNVTHLDLSYSGFVGQVPISISALTNLIELEFGSNDLYLHGTGLITLLSNLTKLQVLDLIEVDISLNESEWGKAVLQIGTTLQELYMEYCGLRGNIPDEIFHLTNLTDLRLSDNPMLPGQLPESIGNLQYLSVLALENCSFYGDVPRSIINLRRLETLYLGSNRFAGMIPMSLFSHPSLEDLDLSNNHLSGFIPDFSNGSSSLGYIYLDDNNLQGQLPTFMFKSPELQMLHLESNYFHGSENRPIPS